MRLTSMTMAMVVCALSGIATGDEGRFAAEYAGPIEQSHGIDDWRKQAAVAYDIVIEFGGKKAFEAKTIYEIGSERVRIETVDGVVMVWDGEDAYVSPADAEWPGPPARFHLRTWTYFFAAPFKLRDPGAHLKPHDAPLSPAHKDAFPSAKLTFEDNVGDAPDDWYIVYKTPAGQGAEAHRLKAMAYIVTFGVGKEKAEEEPHAIVYGGYQQVEGVVLSTRWQFHHWSAEKGYVGEPIGRATLSNLRFVEPAERAFVVPDGARKDELPGKP